VYLIGVANFSNHLILDTARCVNIDVGGLPHRPTYLQGLIVHDIVSGGASGLDCVSQ